MADQYEDDPGMQELHQRDLRNEQTPVHRPVVQCVDIEAAVDADLIEPAALIAPEGDGAFAAEALEHEAEEREATGADPDTADLPGFETASPCKDAEDAEDDPETPTFDESTGDFHNTVGELPDENGATVDDHGDDGFAGSTDEGDNRG